MDTTEAAVRGDGRVILDMTVSKDHIASIGAMNGHEGDNGRVIKFVAYDQANRPANLQGYTVDLIGTDSSGKLKVGGHYQPIDPAVGTFDFTMPGAFYQKDGDYTRAYFRIKDNNDQVISTINIMFTVVAGVGFISSGDSTIYNGYIEDLLAKSEAMVKKYTDTIQKLVDGNQGEVTAMRSLIDNMLAELKDNQAALLGANNSFTGNNHFSGTTTIDKLAGGAMDAINAAIRQAVGSIQFPPQVSSDGWNRNYTLQGPVDTKGHNDALMVQQIWLPSGNKIITGAGMLNITAMQGSNTNEFVVKLPYDAPEGSMVLGQIWQDWAPSAWQVRGNSEVHVTMKNALTAAATWVSFVVITPSF